MTRRGFSNLEPSTPAPLSYKVFLGHDLENTHVEWVGGEVVPMAPVSFEHQAIRLFLVVILSHFLEQNDLGVLCDDPFQMKTSADLPGRAPDILFVARKNLSRLKKTHLEGPADLVVEIISEESRGVDRGEKFFEYEQGGVREYWLIDPIRRQAEFYCRTRDGHFRQSSVEGDSIFRSIVLKGLWLNVDWLWKRPTLRSVLKEWKLL